jgi:hypothetical protein
MLKLIYLFFYYLILNTMKITHGLLMFCLVICYVITLPISLDDLKNAYNLICSKSDNKNDKCKDLEDKILEYTLSANIETHIESHNENNNNPIFTQNHEGIRITTNTEGVNDVIYKLHKDINDLDKKLSEISNLKHIYTDLKSQINVLQSTVNNINNKHISTITCTHGFQPVHPNYHDHNWTSNECTEIIPHNARCITAMTKFGCGENVPPSEARCILSPPGYHFYVARSLDWCDISCSFICVKD